MVGHHGARAVVGYIAIHQMCCARVNSNLAHVLDWCRVRGGQEKNTNKRGPEPPKRDHKNKQRGRGTLDDPGLEGRAVVGIRFVGQVHENRPFYAYTLFFKGVVSDAPSKHHI